MGLDSVELVMAFEEAFELAIPDEVAATLLTPRQVIDYLHSQLPGTAVGACLPQRAFYRVRRALLPLSPRSRAAIGPSTRFADVFPDDLTENWGRLRVELGAAKWPQYSPGASTVGELSEFLGLSAPYAFLAPDERWSRAQVAAVVHRIIHDEIGITDYSEDSRFVQDMGID